MACHDYDVVWPLHRRDYLCVDADALRLPPLRASRQPLIARVAAALTTDWQSLITLAAHCDVLDRRYGLATLSHALVTLCAQGIAERERRGATHRWCYRRRTRAG